MGEVREPRGSGESGAAAPPEPVAAGSPGSAGESPVPFPLARWCGLVGGPLLALLVAYLLPSGDPELTAGGRYTAVVGALMAVLWMTEALPLPATALLPILLFPLGSVFPAGEGHPSAIRQAAAPYANEYIFLFMGGFLIALAIERWGLHRRVALLTVLAVGTRPKRLVGGFMLSTALLSMWISNTASTMMMLPIATSVVRLVEGRVRDAGEGQGGGETLDPARGFAPCLLLSIAYAASIGGIGTLIGTPPNVFLAGYLESTFGIEIGFARWMLVGVPLAALFLFITWLVLTRVVFPIRLREIPGGRELIQSEYRRLGPVSRGEWTVIAVFALTASLWIFRKPLGSWDAFVELVPFWPRVHDAGIALLGALLLFALPVRARRGLFALDWSSAGRLPWGVLLLFGGGLSLAAAASSTGLSAWICHQIPVHLPLFALIVVVSTIVILLTELTSNMATASIFLPILGDFAIELHVDPLLLVVPAGIAASCAFMLPVATPPNAIVFGSGEIRISQMIRAGCWLVLIGIVLIPLVTWTLVAWLLAGG